MARTAWKCSTMSVCRLRITQRSSASVPRCGKQLADPEARFAALTEPERRAQQRALARFIAAQAERRDRLAVMPAEGGLVVERIDMRKPAGQEDHDQVLGLRRMVGRLRCEQACAVLLGRSQQRRVQAGARRSPRPRPPTSRSRAGRSRFDSTESGFMNALVDVKEFVGRQHHLGQARPRFALDRGLRRCARRRAPFGSRSGSACQRSISSGSGGRPQASSYARSIRRLVVAGSSRSGDRRNRPPVPARTGCSSGRGPGAGRSTAAGASVDTLVSGPSKMARNGCFTRRWVIR